MRLVGRVSLASLVVLVAAPAAAHTVAVDGNPAEWSSRAPSFSNVGFIARDAGGGGETIWIDAALDERTDFGFPNARVDLRAFQATGDADNLYLLFRLAGGGAVDGAQVQVALDVDRVAGSGVAFLSGFADTTVANPWERLLQVTVRASGPIAVMYDTAFIFTAPPAAAAGPDGIEVSIPWTSLGLAGPPPVLRASLATFQADANGTVWDVGGPTVANALDVLTDYGNPGRLLGTWTELSDGVLDDYIDLWFDASGEAASPLLVDRFVSNATTSDSYEWLRVVNVSSAPLPLAGFRITDEETASGNEFAGTFPAATLAAGATATVSAFALPFESFFGRMPDFDMSGGVLTVPQLTLDAQWGPGPWALFDPGDEILILDPTFTVIDAVAYGTGDFASVGQLPAPALRHVFARTAPYVDTDGAADFVDLGVECGDSAACDDGNACTVNACSAEEICAPATPVDCNDQNACTADSCGPAVGCTHANRALGSVCPDGDACNGTEMCDGAGVCQPGTPLSCDDANACTDDSCDPISGCVNVNAPEDTPCRDANACNGEETCNAAGACRPGTPLSCDDANPCTTDACDVATGCTHANLMGTSCADGTVCNGAETCNAGVCQAGAALNCDDSNPCTTDACDAATGCTHVNLTGTSCANGTVCDGAETCNAGVCQAGAAPSCDDSNPCTADACDAILGCTHANLTGTSCADATVCNGAETCNAGVCQAGSAPSCDDANPCTADACDAVLGCTHANLTGTSCADATVCNGAETCNAGVCQAGGAPNCDDGNPCTADACDPVTGCTQTNLTGTSCADATVCNGAETCNAGVCQAGAAPSCDDSNPCTADACDAVNGCGNTNLTGTSCANGTLCDGAETCNGGVCQAGTAPDCDDLNPCTADACDALTGCTHENVLPGTSCADADLCDGDETCDAGGNCQAAVALDCDDGNPCTVDSCGAVDGCTYANATAGSACSDGQDCNGGEHCDDAGNCLAGSTCDDPAAPSEGGCGCGSGQAGSLGLLLVTLAALRPRRRARVTSPPGP
jgi:hypothetical protein